jgi:hypothetical protein
MADKPLPAAKFGRWLRPAEVLRQLPDETPEEAKQRSILRRLADGHIRSVARHSVYEDDKTIGGGDFLPVHQSLWAFPWRAADTDFWTTGDIKFTFDPNQHDDSGLGLPMVITADTPPPPPPPPPPRYIVRDLLDVRLCPTDVARQFGATVSPPPPPVAKKGGRPPAQWWDDLWIDIARQLYAGDLKPDNQAVIEKAMLDWLVANGHEAGETTIRRRARRLFEAVSREDQN